MRRLLIVVAFLYAGVANTEGSWPYYGNDAGGSRYSPLTQIDAARLDQLEIAWQFRTGEMGQNARPIRSTRSGGSRRIGGAGTH